jgi:L-fuculose-phosphate aldolase
MGRVPLIPYATPGTPALGDLVEPFVPDNEALLLANHGAITWGPDLRLAQIRMESLEHGARIMLNARLLGRTVPLTAAQLADLERPRGKPGHG